MILPSVRAPRERVDGRPEALGAQRVLCPCGPERVGLGALLVSLGPGWTGGAGGSRSCIATGARDSQLPPHDRAEDDPQAPANPGRRWRSRPSSMPAGGCGTRCCSLLCSMTPACAIGKALGLRHEDIAAAEREVTVVPRHKRQRRTNQVGGPTRTIPVSTKLVHSMPTACTEVRQSLTTDSVFRQPTPPPTLTSTLHHLCSPLPTPAPDRPQFQPHWSRPTAAHAPAPRRRSGRGWCRRSSATPRAPQRRGLWASRAARTPARVSEAGRLGPRAASCRGHRGNAPRPVLSPCRGCRQAHVDGPPGVGADEFVFEPRPTRCSVELCAGFPGCRRTGRGGWGLCAAHHDRWITEGRGPPCLEHLTASTDLSGTSRPHWPLPGAGLGPRGRRTGLWVYTAQSHKRARPALQSATVP